MRVFKSKEDRFTTNSKKQCFTKDQLYELHEDFGMHFIDDKKTPHNLNAEWLKDHFEFVGNIDLSNCSFETKWDIDPSNCISLD